jgi:hypothetical protein
MKRSIMDWYNNLTNNKKLLVLFVVQWMYWALAWTLFKKLWPDEEPESTMQFLFHCTWMAIWMTASFHWKKVKLLFTKKKSEQ